MSHKPKVSIVSISYNQEKYIGEALESFVSQQTDFDFEVVIADDCSKDKTPEIIRQYAKNYPSIIRPILRQNNIGAQANSINSLQAATGDYIALCEGDDYWTDPHKLQKQVDFLDSHPDYSMCFHPVKVFFEGSDEPDFIYPDVPDKSIFNNTELLKWNFIQTNSVMYRRQDYKNIPNHVLPLDWYLHLYHAQFGKIGFIDQVMSAYRRHPGGIWHDSSSDEIWRKHGLAHLALYDELLKLYGSDAGKKAIIQEHITKLLENFAAVDAKYGDNLTEKATLQFPDLVRPEKPKRFLKAKNILSRLKKKS